MPRSSDPSDAAPGVLLRRLFRRYRWRILFTYGLFNLENALRLAQPLVLGLAIDGLLAGAWAGLLLFVAQHASWTLVGSLRQAYDTRAFTAIHAELASSVVTEQRANGVEVSSVAARSTLSQDFVDFFERDVPVVVQSLYSVAGGLAALAFYDPSLAGLCLALLVPALPVNVVYGRKTLFYTSQLNDRLEREVAVIEDAAPGSVREHYAGVARARVKLSDWGAFNFGVMELFVLALLAAALVRACSRPDAGAGDIFATLQYVVLYVSGLDAVPLIVEQWSRLRDVGRRLAAPGSDGDAGQAEV